MANSAQARKRARQAETHRQHNASLRSMYRTYLKKVRYALEAGKADEAKAAYQAAQPVIDKMVNKRILPKNTAARYKSRLVAQIKKLVA